MKPVHLSHDLHHARWRKSTRSTSNSHCVEVAVTSQAIGVRDTKDRDSGTLAFDHHAWSTFTTALKANDLTG